MRLNQLFQQKSACASPECRRRPTRIRTLLGIVLILVLGLAWPGCAMAASSTGGASAASSTAGASATEATAPAGPAEKLLIGAYVTGLGDLDPAKKSFSASFWVWSVGTAATAGSLNNLEFPNAIKVESPNELSATTPRGVWVQRKIVGSFRHGWDLHRFPFDRQLLRIQLEEAEQDTTSLIYIPDKANSSIDPDIKLAGWRLSSAGLVTSDKQYHTSFGDPRLASGSPSAYARAELRLVLERTDRSGFWKLTVGAFAAALMALASYGLRVDQVAALSPRFGLLAGSAFAAVISLRSAASELGASGYTTLIDAVHALVLLYILMATAAAVMAWRAFLRHGDAVALQRLEQRVAGYSSLAFGVGLLALVLGAMAGGPN
jgi:hypothetical protein